MARKLVLILSFIIFTLVLTASAQQASQAQPKDLPDKPAAPAKAHEGLTFDWGFEQRIRTENWDNIVDLNNSQFDERHQVRFRNRFWFKVPFGESVDFFAGLNNEFKKQTTPELKLNGDEVIFESLYLDFKKLPIRGLSMRVGRQNLMRGEGVMLFDGSSGDGSRTAYFNAVDISYKFRKSNLELIGILDPRQDRFLPVINDQNKYLNEWDEQAVGLYYTDKNRADTDFEAYYFYKKEVNDYRAPTNPQFQPDRHISTLGGRAVHRFNKTVSATGELAMQWGAQHPATEIRGWSGYGYVKKTFPAKWKPYVLGGYWALSGDDPKTANKIEGWDPVFSRWPKWSELYLYSLIKEKGVGYWTNDRFLQAEAGFSPWKPINIRATWYHHDAFHPFPGSATTFSDGTRRGDNFQVRGDFVVNQYVKGHLLYENFMPGNYYKNDPLGYFFRAEIIYTFKGAIPMGRKK